MLVQLKLIPV